MTEASSPEVSKPVLENLEPKIKLFITQLEKENLKLHEQIVKLQVSDISKSNKIKAMEKEISELTKQSNNVTIYLPYNCRDGLPTHIQTPDGKMVEVSYDKNAYDVGADKT